VWIVGSGTRLRTETNEFSEMMHSKEGATPFKIRRMGKIKK
jgi:hypothetical protein